MTDDNTKVVTLDDGHHVWTKSVGEGPIKLLLLHGGPGMTHDYLSPFSNFIKDKPIQVIYYDQLGSYNSDQPDDSSLWNIERFCNEVDAVRKAWNLENFYLYGQSWGGTLAMEYALIPEYRKKLKGLIVSNMVDDMSEYADYVNEYRNKVLSPDDIDYMKTAEKDGTAMGDAKYMQLSNEMNHQFMCRLSEWSDDVNASFMNMNPQVCAALLGTNSFDVTGSLKDWSVRDRLSEIDVPTLLLGAKYDSMNPETIKAMGNRFPNAQVHICSKGSHLSLWDNADEYFNAIDQYIDSVEN